ncbi:MAG: S9 family peptidase [Steroidobacteraceae bacterium]
MNRLVVVIALSAFSAISAWAEAQDRRVTLADLGTRVDLFSPAISPDGKQVVVVAARANYADNRFEQSLVLIDAITGAQRDLASGHSSVQSPKWSPRGDQLAWLDAAGGDGRQVYVTTVGQVEARAVRITNAKKAVESFEWSPDGQSIAFITADPQEELEGEERHNKSFRVIDNDYLATEALTSSHVWVVSIAGGEPRRLTTGVESVTGIGWHPNGQLIAFASQQRPHNGEFTNASSITNALKTVDMTGESQHVVVPSGMARIVGVPKSSAPQSAPNGNFLAYLRFHGADTWTYTTNVAVVRSSGGDVRDVTTSIDRDIGEFVWLPDSKGLVAVGPDGTRHALWLQPLDGPARRLNLGSVIDISNVAISATGVLAFIGTEARHPPEIYIKTSVNAEPRRLTRFNDRIAALQLGDAKTIKWRNDGFDQGGVLIYPADFKEGQKVPLVVNIHGGPEGTSTEAFDLFDQIMAGQGWAVFKPNYRGSTSQGEVFQSAVVNDPADGPGRDIMAGVAAVRALGVVDGDRVAVSGWSYGGYMTAWLIGHYQGWRSAVVGSAITNYLDWYDLSCCGIWASTILGGSPWLKNNAARYWQASPVAYADKVKTPTLIFAHTGDPVSPVTMSYNLYNALRDNGVPVEFIVYPIGGHWPVASDPVNERDTYRRWIGWFEQHFRAPKEGQN